MNTHDPNIQGPPPVPNELYQTFIGPYEFASGRQILFTRKGLGEDALIRWTKPLSGHHKLSKILILPRLALVTGAGERRAQTAGELRGALVRQQSVRTVALAPRSRSSTGILWLSSSLMLASIAQLLWKTHKFLAG